MSEVPEISQVCGGPSDAVLSAPTIGIHINKELDAWLAKDPARSESFDAEIASAIAPVLGKWHRLPARHEYPAK